MVEYHLSTKRKDRLTDSIASFEVKEANPQRNVQKRQINKYRQKVDYVLFGGGMGGYCE